MRLVAIAGTGTEVGKTTVATALIRELLSQGFGVSARKPAQSFAPGDGPTDADLLAGATGEPPDQVCPPAHWYPVPLAPPMAAEVLGWPAPTIAGLASLQWPPAEIGLVELAGGVRSPQAADGDGVDLLEAIGPALIVLVADAGLGTINLVRLSVGALGRWPVVVFLNRYDDEDDLHRRNRRWLGGRERLSVEVDVTSLAARVAGRRGRAPDGRATAPALD